MSDRPQWMLELARFGIDGLTPEARLERIVACYSAEEVRVWELREAMDDLLNNEPCSCRATGSRARYVENSGVITEVNDRVKLYYDPCPRCMLSIENARKALKAWEK